MEKVYLDYNATTPLEEDVIEGIVLSLKNEWANPSSSSSLGVSAKNAIEKSRKETALAINANSSDIIFTSGGTEASNMAIYTAVKMCKETGCSQPHIITSNVEHIATINPLKELEKHDGVIITEVSVDKRGMLSSEDIISAIKHNTCLITVMLANNETGVIFPIGEITCQLKKINKERKSKGLQRIMFHSDAAQAVGKIRVDVQALDIDFLTIAGHKFYGPRIGALYVRSLGKGFTVYPVMQGGGQERGYRPGTENTPMIVGLGKAAALVESNLGLYSVQMKETRDYLEDKIHEAWDNIVINCVTVPRLPNTTNISFRGLPCNGAELLQQCQYTIASTAAACHSQSEPSGILIASGVPKDLAMTSIRFSTGRQTSKHDIERAVIDIKNTILRVMKKYS